MQGPPIYYDYANRYNAITMPSTVHISGTALAHFFKRYLLQKTISVFRWGFPTSWPANFFLYVLYCNGFLAVVNTDRFGVVPQPCGLRGYDVFYQPTNAIITNPLLRGTLEPRIGKQCVLLRLSPDYGGVMDLVSVYGDMMALCLESAGVNLLNSKLAYVFTAADKSAAESFKKLFDRVASGEPAVVQDRKLLTEAGEQSWGAFSQNVGQNYIADRILADLRKIENMFDTAIGIPNANTDKRERLISDEVNANNVETATRCDMWLDELKKGCEEVNQMFGPLLDRPLSVEWRVPPVVEEVKEDAVNA